MAVLDGITDGMSAEDTARTGNDPTARRALVGQRVLVELQLQRAALGFTVESKPDAVLDAATRAGLEAHYYGVSCIPRLNEHSPHCAAG